MTFAVNISNVITRITTEFKTIRTFISGSATGNLSGLTTTSKTSLVSAINEVKAGNSGSPPSASETVSGIIEIASLAEVITGTDSLRAVTPQGVKQATNAVKTEILGAGVPEALDTLDELAAALGNDSNFAASMTTNLAGKQPLNTDLTAIAGLTSAADKVPYSTGAGTWSMATFTAAGRALIDDADIIAQRTTLSVYSKSELGDPETDFVAVFEAGLL